MSLKDEIEKLITAEQSKLQDRDKMNMEFKERQRQRFIPLRVVLEEIAESVGSKYLGTHFRDASARLEFGNKKGSKRQVDTRWNIEPNYSINFSGESSYSEEPGFKVEETVYCYYPTYGMTEDKLTFVNEEALSEFLVEVIAESIAFQRHLKSQFTKQ